MCTDSILSTQSTQQRRMGNTIKSGPDFDPDGPENEVAFFQALSIKWLNIFINKIRETKNTEFTLSHSNDTLKWSDYFRIFVEIKDSMVTELSTKERGIWHPATKGFAMIKRDPADSSHTVDVKVEKSDNISVADDYTEDDPSVADDGTDEDDALSHSEERQRKASARAVAIADIRPRNWNPAFTNPIYFGYSTATVAEYDKALAREKAELKARENRAIDRARATRSVAIDALEKATSAQAAARLEKVEKLRSKYEASKKKRETDLERSERELLPAAFALYERKWEMETTAAEAAFITEVGRMRRVHEEKSAADMEYLRKKREEMESFKDAEKQEIPAAERLEEFARIEVSRCIEELDRCGLEMENMRLEYREMKADFDEVAHDLALAEERGTIDKAKQRRLQEMRSMVSVAETRMREAQRKMQEALDSLGDAEVLLDRAVRLCRQQSDLLPLFRLIARDEHLPSSCKLNALVIAMVVLMSGPFEQKYNVLFRLFDAECEGRVGLAFVVALFSSVQEALYLLRLLPQGTTKEELVNVVTRGVMSYGLNPSRDLLTEFELRSLVLSLVSHSSLLTKVLGLTARCSMQPGAVTFDGGEAANVGTYQRNRMGALALLSRGMINLSMCRMRVHYDALRYKPCLQGARKQQMHERAMLMGQDDPLKPDYTRFYVKQNKVDEYRVPPLSHGHLHNLQFFEHRLRTNAAIKLQAWFRSRHDRKMAELAARHMAFKEAKTAALREMKAKVVREFKKREGGKGMGKMKWDAQVRMRQAKLRTMGQAVGRSDTVMIMMEEAIAAAKEDIEARFRQLEAKEEFSTFNFERVLVLDDPARQVLDLTAKFGQVVKPSIGDTSMLQGEGKDGSGSGSGSAGVNKLLLEHGAEEEEDAPETANLPHAAGNGQIKLEGPEKTPAGLANFPGTKKIVSFLATVDPLRVRAYVQGKFSTPLVTAGMDPEALARVDPHAPPAGQPRGESEMEFELRLRMAAAEPPRPEFLFNRLRAVNIAMTKFKTEEVLGEVPSKRLLIKYVAQHDDAGLAEELTKHFKFKSKQAQIVKVLRNIARTDIENGTLRLHLFETQLKAEAGILCLFEQQMAAFDSSLSAMVELRLSTNRKLKQEAVLEEELARAEGFLNRFRAQSIDQLAQIEEAKRKFHRVLLSCFEVEKKWRSIRRYTEARNGTLDPTKKEVPLELRQNWVLRFNQATKMSEATAAAVTAKYSEIRNVCREFLDTAASDAMIIVNEIHQPKYRKTIPVAEEFVVHGRVPESGRGLDGGKWYTYEAHNIVYKVCLDYDGVFNGSDEYAAKAGGAERLGAQEYLKLQSPKLMCPLVVTIDYLGFRVLACSKLPVQNVSFSDDGEVRKISEDLEHGVAQKGEVFINQSKIIQTCLKMTASSLNLAEHVCKGSKDITSSSTFASAELKIYRGQRDGEYHMQNFWRCFPPEVPHTTPHLPLAPRGQSVFWRMLRPEYVREYKEPLSPDALCAITFRAPDSQEHVERLEKASSNLVDRVVPQFLLGLLKRDYVLPLAEGFGIDLPSEMHAQGINVRHLGLMRSLLWHPLPGTVSLYHHESCVRTSQDLRQEVRDGDSIRVGDDVFVVQETAKKRITPNMIPVSAVYKGESKNGLTARAGRISFEKNSDEMRKVLLAEMVARTVKALVRFQMRAYSEQYKCTSVQFFSALVTEYLNVLTGSSPTAEVVTQQTLCDAVRERFGERAILPSERWTLLLDLRAVLSYLVSRVVSMLGVRLSLSCESEFHERPSGFLFSVADITEVLPVKKHNIPLLPFADAMTVSLLADATEQEVYVQKVLMDAPVVFYALSERKGARLTENKGTLGEAFCGAIRKGCELEHPGPIASNKFVRAMCFRPNAKSFVEVDSDPLISPPRLLDPFSAELYFCCTGGKDTVRVMLMCGRYAMLVTRDNQVAVMYYEGPHEVNVKLGPVQYDQWTHLVCTYDGTTLRCYVNSALVKYVEVAGVLAFKQRLLEDHDEQKRVELKEAEKVEQLEVKERSRREALEFFQTKDGVATLKRLTREILESTAFQSENIGANAKDQAAAVKERRSEALKRAKDQYMADHLQYNVDEIAKRYQQLFVELDEHLNRSAHDSAQRVVQGLRLGAATPNSRTVDGSYFFHGRLSCVSVYSTCLTADQVKDHHLASVVDRRLDAQRMHAIAASKFELALKQGPPETSAAILNAYAKSLCSYLRIQTPDAFSKGKAMGKVKILDMIQRFKGMKQGNTIAEILREVPREPENAEVVSRGFLSLRNMENNFFSRSVTLRRSEIVHLPFDFALLSPESPPHHWEAAAYIFQEVVRDSQLMYAYGELDLRWLPDLQSAPLIISLVKAAMEDKNLRIVKLSEIFSDAGLQDMAVNDDDVLVMSQNLPMSEGFDLSHCGQLTNVSLSHIDHMNNIKVLCLNHCSKITDAGLLGIRTLFGKLQVLGLEGLTSLSDEGLMPVAEKCVNLQTVNVSKCPNISHVTLVPIARRNPQLNSLSMAGTSVDDEAMSLICAAMQDSGCGKSMTALDISNCRDLTDLGVSCVAEVCSALTRLSMSGLCRVSDVGVRSVCANCWHLEYLNVEDVFLLKDNAFWFSATFDGRRAANENMLVSLQTLVLSDCSNLTDHGIEGLAERCRKLDTLVLQGCDKLTDAALRYLADPNICTASSTAMCDAIRTLNLSFCTGITGPGVQTLLSACACLEELNLSGLATIVTDSFVLAFTKCCPTLQKLVLQKCLLLTDAALCAMADNLWLELLDVTGCTKLTDAGVEVLSEACSGLRSVTLRRAKRLTDKALFALMRNCKGLLRVDLQECPLITAACAAEAREAKPVMLLLM